MYIYIIRSASIEYYIVVAAYLMPLHIRIAHCRAVTVPEDARGVGRRK